MRFANGENGHYQLFRLPWLGLARLRRRAGSMRIWTGHLCIYMPTRAAFYSYRRYPATKDRGLRTVNFVIRLLSKSLGKFRG